MGMYVGSLNRIVGQHISLRETMTLSHEPLSYSAQVNLDSSVG